MVYGLGFRVKGLWLGVYRIAEHSQKRKLFRCVAVREHQPPGRAFGGEGFLVQKVA